MASVERSGKARAALMPDEQSAVNMFFEAWLRLKELGWNNADYCPKDGSEFNVIEAGSTGIHRCVYVGPWPDGKYWIVSDNDLWPSRPVLYKNIEGATTEPNTGPMNGEDAAM